MRGGKYIVNGFYLAPSVATVVLDFRAWPLSLQVQFHHTDHTLSLFQPSSLLVARASDDQGGQRLHGQHRPGDHAGINLDVNLHLRVDQQMSHISVYFITGIVCTEI